MGGNESAPPRLVDEGCETDGHEQLATHDPHDVALGDPELGVPTTDADVVEDDRVGPKACSAGPPRPQRREGDLIIGNNHSSAIGTLVERQTRLVRLVHLPRSDADSLHAVLVAPMQDLPPGLMRSITWDQGTEMARHLATAANLGAPLGR